jgi:8-oxo-dGTP pyrophosphatase MutT (NUDIX family)
MMSKKTAIPKPATTIIIIRQIKDSEEIEVLMTKRQKHLKFLGGFYCFPGGKVEKQDYSDASIRRLRGIDYQNALNILDVNDELKNEDIINPIYFGYWIAGFRELFEEIGILLVEDKNGSMIHEFDDEKFIDYRMKITNDEILMSEMMEKEDFYYPANRLFYSNHFITPRLSPKRFDTRFFICKITRDHEIFIKPHEKEISDLIWIKPQEAIDRCTAGKFKIIFPQIVSLKDLTNFKPEDLQLH